MFNLVFLDSFTGHLIIFLLACSMLVKSSGWLVKALVKISSFLKLNEFTVGFIIMSVSTSLPELFIGIISAINKQSVLSLGNVIGSNILNLTIVIGIVTLLANGINIKSKIIKRDMLYMVGIVFAPVFLMVDHLLWKRIGITVAPGISQVDGGILLLIFALYIWNLIRQERLFRKTVDKTTKKEVFKYFILFVISFGVLMVSAEFAVHYADKLSIDLSITPLLLGLFILSLGTSLPELVFETKAVLSRHQDMAIGDLIGSVIANSTLVLGMTAVIHPIQGDIIVFLTSTLFMLVVSFLFLTFAESDKGLSWKEGMSLILMYLLFMIVELYIKTLKVPV